MKLKITNLFTMLLALMVYGANLNAETYYSKGNLDATLTSSWNSNMDGTSGTAPGNFVTTGDIFYIQNGHSMTTSQAWTIGATSGNTGKLQIANGGKLTGTFDITIKSGVTFQIDAGGTYEHNVANNLSSLFGGTESFDTNSNFIVTSCANSLSGTPDNGYGNLTFNNIIGDSNLGLNAKVLSVKGSLFLQVTCTGVKTLTFVGTQTGSAATINIGGDLVVNSPDGTGSVLMTASGGSPTVTVAGAVRIQSGTLNLNASTGTSTLNIGGDLNISSGGTLSSTNGTNASTINFTGNSIFTKTAGGALISTANINIGVATNATLTLASSFTVGLGRTLNVNGTINIGASDILIGGSTIGSGIINAANGTVTYNGTAAQQISNIKDNSLQNLVINNSNGVSLTTPLIVNGTLNIILGNLSLGNNNLTIETTGSIIGTEANIILNGTGVLIKKRTSLHNVPLSSINLSVSNNVVIIHGLEPENFINIYTFEGKSVYAAKAKQSDLQLSLPNGLYVVKLKTQTSSKFTIITISPIIIIFNPSIIF